MMTIAALAQLLIALAFVSIPLVRARYGAAAKDAVGAELTRQGVRPAILEENGLRLDAGGHETWAPVGIALVMTTLAVANLAGNGWGQTLSWIFQVLVLLGNGAILYSNLTAAKSIRAAFARKGDPELARVDVERFLDAAGAGFPRWVMPYLQNLRHVIVFGGSIVVLIALVVA
ncbi:hypothetical protein OG874_32815 [Nocardia sp. NBC_00565]|uniref:hypothetical protein n=1 Tax=Nocardia sp. NBC_00565 TaxID=2975993 RepID=UPI002E803548|nr:hypothetical protein [Nocardia sp. NBC_00565]WUC01543.1 hypothetical protein OG874_32815 [Nocardia sp. NBC_00565]